MNSYHITYRIPFGFNDILKKRKIKSMNNEKVNLLQQFNSITAGFPQIITPEMNKRFRLMFINAPIQPSENDTKTIIRFFKNVLDTFPVSFHCLSPETINVLTNDDNASVTLSYNETDLTLSITIKDLQLDKHIKTMATTLDEMMSSFDFLVYKYCHENEKTRAFSNAEKTWNHKMHGFIGVDVGSVSTNVIFLDQYDNVIETVYTYTRGRVLDAIKTSFMKLQQMLPVNAVIMGVGTTGSSGEMAKTILNADTYRTEIYSHAAATIHQIPDVQTILEIGGQDSKVIYVNNGIPEKSKMNEWCGAGTGAMLDAQANRLGIPIEDIIIDPLVLTVGADSQAGAITLKTIQLVHERFGVNINLGASNVSFGLPERDVINQAFLAMTIQAGATCAITDPARLGAAIRASDLLLGRDDYSMRYIKYFRATEALKEKESAK